LECRWNVKEMITCICATAPIRAIKKVCAVSASHITEKGESSQLVILLKLRKKPMTEALNILFK